MGRGKRLFTLKETLETFLSKHKDLEYKIKSQEAVNVWEMIVDEYVKNHTVCALVKDGILFVNADSPPLANELALRENEIREKLNRKLETPLIQRIVFKSGFVKKIKKRIKIIEIKSKDISLKTLNQIDETVRLIQDDELKFIIRKFLITSAMRNLKGEGGGS
jgi:hypothetical protein